MNPTLLALAAALLYVAATVSLRARTGERPRSALGFAAFAALAHALALAMAIHTDGGFALDLLRTGSILAWEAAALTTLAALRLPVATLGLVSFPVGALGAAAILSDSAPPHLITFADWTLEAHVVLSLLAYGVLMLAAGQALLLWYQERRLRARDVQGLLGLLPPLSVMEDLLFHMIGGGIGLLTLALAAGAPSVVDLNGQHLTHKVTLSLIAWLIFAVLLWGRARRNWRGPRAVAFTLVGFGMLALAYFGSRFVLEVLLHRSWG
jgi:ABC-type uncharacterized transport system permease subunit